jgi:transcription elongation factor GreA
MSKVTYLSKEGFESLKEQLRDLKTRGRQDIAREIAEARSQGDLSENAEYDAAKEKQGLLEKKIAELEEILATAKVIDTNVTDTSQVYLLSKVTVFNAKTNKETTYTLVSAQEANFKENKLSIDSPIGKALMGRKLGEKISVKIPAGILELTITKIER